MVHNRQFILSKQEYLIDSDWRKLQLRNGYILSFQKDLHVVCNEDNSIILIGDAWSVDKEGYEPSAFIANIKSYDDSMESYINQVESTWNGRYLLILGDSINLDAVGALGVFYTEHNIGSSLSLICEIENRKLIFPDTKWGEYPDYVPGPYTQIDGVLRVMPSQSYNFVTRSVSYRRFLVDVPQELSKSQLVHELKCMYETSLRNMYQHFEKKPIWLALTGGKDSRTALAFLKHIKLPFGVFSFVFSEESSIDAQIAKRAAPKAKVKHYTISLDQKNYSEVHLAEYRLHTAMMNVDVDYTLYTHKMYDDLKKIVGEDFLMLRNNVWESIMDYYSAYYNEPEDLVEALRGSGKYNKSIDAWLKWVYNDPLNKELSLWDRIFWEQREGCWLSSIEQSLDMMNYMTCVQMCNCRRILAYMHAYPLDERRKKHHNVELINEVLPSLNSIPFNSEVHKGESLRRACIRKSYPRVWDFLHKVKNRL